MPLITGSRMVGAGGAELAARVAALLGWQLVDNGLVDSGAQRLGVSVAEVAEREEKVPTLAQRLAAALALGAPEVLTRRPTRLPPSEERILEVTANVIEEAVAAGPTVVVGRGAQWVLGELEGSQQVLCYAARAELAARIATRLSLSLK